ncbi:hypothetical protein SDC9_131749 [bioreactor metagenome]|uniref:Uncharacterized protein n=1 Tax=bioreactor metagenome TaxID=1076179 RepID=A0A645D5N7_9ZZZZ
MPRHQGRHRVPGGVVELQPPQNGVRDLRADGGMPVEVSSPFIPRKAAGLAHVVEQDRPAQHRLRRSRGQSVERVLPHIETVVAAVLLKAHHGQHLREHRPHDLRKLPQRLRRGLAAEQLCQLGANTLRCDVGKKPPAVPQSPGGFRLDGKPKRGGEPQTAKDTQRILTKPFLRIPHAAQNTSFQIRLSAKGVRQFSPKVHRHGVHSKITAAQIVAQGAGKDHRIRVAAVGVRPVGSKGRDLHRVRALPDSDGTVPQSGGKGTAPEDRQRFLRQSGGRHVPVLRRPAQEGVTDAAAHAVSGVAVSLQ